MEIMDFEHLVLLVGTNPLPNYVVTKYFINENKKLTNIWLVHSSAKNSDEANTAEVANRLLEQIEKQIAQLEDKSRKIILEKIELDDIGNAETIETEITEKILVNIPDGGKLHLNYTGGTKMMAVHVHRTIREYEGKDFYEKTYSYLDARDHKLKSDKGNQISSDLRKKLTITAEEILELHDCLPPIPDKNKARKNAIAIGKIFLKITDNDLEELKTLLQQEIQKKAASKNANINLDNVLTAFDRMLSHLKSYIKYYPYSEEQSDDESILKGFFNNGDWFEVYVGAVINEKFAEHGINLPLIPNCRIEKRKDGVRAEKDFELDLVLINGFQVCLISCTTDTTEGLCKLKAFEVLHRAIQFGGDEAKSMLVCCMSQNSVKRMEKDIFRDFGTSIPLEILGVEDLRPDDLWYKIREHLDLKEKR